MRIKAQDTPLGRIWIAVDPEPVEPRDVIIDVEVHPLASPPEPRIPLITSIRAAVARITNPTLTPEQLKVERIRSDALEAISQAETVIDDLFENYVTRIKSTIPSVFDDDHSKENTNG